jgi:uncharacterized protein YjbI with pentapeptide repeats
MLVALVILGYFFNWDWTGLNATDFSSTPQNITRTIVYQPSKTLWDWLQLLGVLAVPVVVGFGAVWFTTRQGKVADAENKDNQRETALQAYIDKMSELLLHENLRKSKPEDEVRNVARVRTLTVLSRLDGKRKGSVLQFLHESGLINRDNSIVGLVGVDLRGADMSVIFLVNSDLSFADLSNANLSSTLISSTNLLNTNLRDANMRKAILDDSDLYEADLSGANLSKASLRDTSLEKANLIGANLYGADLKGANLKFAGLNGANLVETYFREANLKGADLSGADLRKSTLWNADLEGASLEQADLSGAELIKQVPEHMVVDREPANLEKADLSKANLKGAIVTQEQLKTAQSLQGATMPDGSIHP